MFSKQDNDQFTAKGISLEKIEYQLEKFKSGFPFTKIVNSATPGAGLHSLTDSERKQYAELYNKLSEGLSATRFVPASGAATRMFKSLFSALEELSGQASSKQRKIVSADSDLKTFFSELNTYPFYEDLQLDGSETHEEILRKILYESGLSYGSLPKGLLKFHSYSTGSRTAFEEHLREAVGYCAQGGSVNMHFTVSPEHKDSFVALQHAILPGLEKELSVKFSLSFSFQKEETDTIAADKDNQPFRDTDGKIVFRPGGHGALLENLNEVDGDIVFISNIDNIAPDRFMEARVDCKKFLGGIILNARELIYKNMRILSRDELPSDKFFSELFSWLNDEVYIAVPGDIVSSNRQTKRDWAMKILDRPLRVCGMVKNEGEPGGGPFFVEDSRGQISLQIVEPSQIDTDDPDQKEILQRSTHFNPVDLVCSIRNYKGEKYDLMDYRDPETGFVTAKSMLGKDLKAQELPGLWNGSMAQWTTLFVEVPMLTFTPVKTVFDLTRPEHKA